MPVVTDVVHVVVLNGYVVLLTFADGSKGIVNLDPLMQGPIFDEVRDKGLMAQVAVDPDLGTIVWPNGADLPPHRLKEESMSPQALVRELDGSRSRSATKAGRFNIRLVGGRRSRQNLVAFDKLAATLAAATFDDATLFSHLSSTHVGTMHLHIELAAGASPGGSSGLSRAEENEAAQRFRSAARILVAS